ncbi:uncharacterized protein LOC142768840 [Rhipicephalus microplus]|uniref:uncharacterized protein LOC142768840 n=1 Tax=Rhipicephalus microplus TaxID=6941 RepID=UPI003F6A58BC
MLQDTCHIVHDSLPGLLHTGSACQLSLLAKVDEAFFRAQVERPISWTIPLIQRRTSGDRGRCTRTNWCGETNKVRQNAMLLLLRFIPPLNIKVQGTSSHALAQLLPQQAFFLKKVKGD